MSISTRQAFGQRVRLLRMEREFSLRMFALTIGVDKSFLVNIEHGRVSPTLDTIEKIARGLNVTISFLMQGIDTVGPVEYEGER
ncbi:helix-turn-helix domain-containing protein [Olsenella profusa]|uniref:Helix-turn-helix transcriptional regulator n=1 Tax=Olsenella profusa TaxID=138595 RepID=A0ABS2F3Y2_9ACTN|nr:helix-turn-helix transcriptional regulator [Olsenella profusa]MBM6775234.1 helix-turn-helix transcriptional regulator [Olsenella profusa]